MGEREQDIGHDFTLREYREGNELKGYTVTGPAAPACRSPYNGRCGGLVPTQPVGFPRGDGGERAVWKLEQAEPVTLSPSIQCECGGQHGYVRDGKWVPA